MCTSTACNQVPWHLAAAAMGGDCVQCTASLACALPVDPVELRASLARLRAAS
eukprot:CAMPEP_0202864900 /NCGR_PEP_ID=MMETSP1391-20130828/4952_1 /ASSEMBLY_ACC=CAM_ASM_000867 /TAXON_ID=1034604 /ORGANISM="Chlamydomonas leiostraca, Strain SAG 11-49" /LENGTH=52 /DNA_ID=CAMNT_0049544677 /DNA_START=395 /DNA_END=553 /DNA_ORIENTATION=-